MRTQRPLAGFRAFTLVELLVVIAIVAVLFSLVIPSLGKARERSEQIRDIANVRAGSYHFLTYFNDHKNFIPPLPTWGPGGASWYAYIRPYIQLGNPNGTTYQEDKPFALMCQSRVNGSSTGSLPFFRYAMNTNLRWRTAGVALTSYRIDELQTPNKTGLLFCAGPVPGADYYMNILCGLSTQFVAGSLSSTAQHNGTGNSVSYLDGRAEFVKVINGPFVQNLTIAQAQTVPLSQDIPWAHRSFWGKTNTNVWLNAQYKFND
jgi:prepilin-type N-terminal cleavage/methylation domain-containing protein